MIVTAGGNRQLLQYMARLLSLSAAVFLCMYFLAPERVGIAPLLLVSPIIASICYKFFRRDFAVEIDLFAPASFYGGFYLLYYVLPFLFSVFGENPIDNETFIALMLFLGYFSFLLGARLIGRIAGAGENGPILAPQQRYALLITGLLAMTAVFVFNALRVKNGIFFNQAMFYEQATSVSASFMDVFVQQLQLPLVLIFGLVSGGGGNGVSRGWMRVLWWGYSAMAFLLFLFSSQTRPAITVIIFALVARDMYRPVRVKFSMLLLFTAFSVFSLVAIQGLRIIDVQEFMTADNQLVYAAKNLIPTVVKTFTGHLSEVGDRVSDRSEGGIQFLSKIVSATDREGSFLWGKDILVSMFSVIPRFLWKDKPAVTAPQLVIQDALGLPQYDASVSPIVQFYVEGGWPMVVAGYILFGLLLSGLSGYVYRSRSVAPWLIFFCIWGYISIVENELVLGLMGTLKNAISLFMVYCAVYSVLSLLSAIKAKANKVVTREVSGIWL